MPATLNPNAATYEDVERLVHHTAHAFQRRCGGDYEELLSEANVIYAATYRSYDPTRYNCKFATALRNNIWYGLMDAYRTRTAAQADWRR